MHRDKTTRQLCDILSISESTVRNWVRRGCPCDGGGPGVERKFDEGEVAAWLRERNLTGAPGRPTTQARAELEEARIRKENALADKYETENAILQGTLVKKEDVDKANVQKVVAVRNALLALPPSLAPALEGLTCPDIQAELERAIHQILSDFARGVHG